MAQPLVAGLPPSLALSSGYVIRLTALDPTTGAAVSGVRVTDVSYFVRPLTAADETESPSPLLVPTNEEG